VEPVVIGLVEHVDLPDWGIAGLRGKVDTGARSSALHVSNIREVGGGRVRFDVRLHRRKTDRTVHVEAKIRRRGLVKPSSGDVQTRIFVSTTLKIGHVEREIEVSLVDREKMIFRLLIGRSAIGRGMLVDPNRRYVVSRGPKRRTRRVGRPAA
jgi:hypothetical protein